MSFLKKSLLDLIMNGKIGIIFLRILYSIAMNNKFSAGNLSLFSDMAITNHLPGKKQITYTCIVMQNVIVNLVKGTS